MTIQYSVPGVTGFIDYLWFLVNSVTRLDEL